MTLLGIGGFPASHPLNLGMMGMHGEAWVNTAIQESDLLIALGMRFDDRVTGNIKTYAPHAKKIHVDIDPGGVQQERPGRRRRSPATSATVVARAGCRTLVDVDRSRVAGAHLRPQGRRRRSATSRTCPTTGTCMPRT